MVAFELAGVEERAGNQAEAIRWYTVAAQRFRRADWKTKAHDGLTRLGAAIPEAPSTDVVQTPAQEGLEPSPLNPSSIEPHLEAAEAVPPTAASDEFFNRVLNESGSPPATPPAGALESAAPAGESVPGRRRHHRGRRGGRGRRKGKGPVEPGVAAQGAPAAPPVATSPIVPAPRDWETAAPTYAERAAEPSAIESQLLMRGRAGDPALASRLAPLESQLRRLLAATPHAVGDSDAAPAGPGVFLVSDSDQITYYYVEYCQTLRIGIANLLRERRTRSEHEPLRARFAEDLGIPEARVAKYLKDNCVVRWLQLDDGAPHLAHFAIAVLRPALND